MNNILSKFGNYPKKLSERASLTLLTTHVVRCTIEIVVGDHDQSWLAITPSIDPKKLSITKKNG